MLARLERKGRPIRSGAAARHIVFRAETWLLGSSVARGGGGGGGQKVFRTAPAARRPPNRPTKCSARTFKLKSIVRENNDSLESEISEARKSAVKPGDYRRKKRCRSAGRTYVLQAVPGTELRARSREKRRRKKQLEAGSFGQLWQIDDLDSRPRRRRRVAPKNQPCRALRGPGA